MRYSFGSITIELEGSKTVFSELRKEWQFFQRGAIKEADVTVVVEQQILEESDNFELHWEWQKSGKVVKAIRYSDGIAEFALCYSEKGNVCSLLLPEINGSILQVGLFYAILTALNGKFVGLHAVSVLIGDQLVLLSAPSGTGKTTLARLLRKSCDAAVVNGDYSLLSVDKDSKVYFEPSPFCGSSKDCHNYRLTVDRIVFLSQDEKNTWVNLGAKQAIASLMSNVFVPAYDETICKVLWKNILRIAELLPMNGFAFAPTEEAAEKFQKMLFCETEK